MVCCAFAAFIVAQIVLALDTLHARIFGAPRAVHALADGAAAWRLGDPAPEPVRPRSRARRLALALGVFALVAGASYVLSLRAPESSSIHAWHPSAWCSTRGGASGE